MRTRGRRPAAAVVVLGLLGSGSGPAAAARVPERVPVRVALDSPQARMWLVRSVAGAQRRLDAPRCQGLLTAFHDAEGVSLRARLDGWGVGAPEYLAWLVFREGDGARLCRDPLVLAFTQPGGRVVWVCSGRFLAVARSDPFYAEAVVIHEALHTLGLRENPPSSREIHSQVVRSCA